MRWNLYNFKSAKVYTLIKMSFTILKVTPLSFNKSFNSDDKENVGNYNSQFGGIFCETKYFWMVRDSYLAVGCTKTGLIIGNWKFGITSKTPIKINCVTELPREDTNIPFLIIGLKCYGGRGMICIFQFTCSKILRAVELPNEVRKIVVVNTIGSKCLLPGPLALLDSVIAVGTLCGGLLLLDMCLQEYENTITHNGVVNDEKNSCQTMDLQLNDISLLESHKNLANLNMEHLAIYLNGIGNCSKSFFNIRGPEGTLLPHLGNENVVVSALYYCSQLCSLFVGYNFGVWQIWNLEEMNVVYTSPILDKNMPVTHFSIQEPCDDPRAFCYVWVIYNNVDSFSSVFPLAVMYALLFDTKIWHDKYGFFYQGLLSCHVRFQRELDPMENNDERQTGGCCTGLFSISKSVSNLNLTQEFTEDGFSYCFFTWNTWTINRKLNTYLTLFDLNQWYKEQMPSSLHKRSKHVDSYTITVSISDFLKSISSEDNLTLLDVKVDFKSLLQFKGAMKLEEHYYPSSLTFNLFILKESEMILLKNRGCQQDLLYQIIHQGPACLMNPSKFYHDSIRTGLTPLFVEHEHYETEMNFQKEFLLNVALEQQLFCWLCKCAAIFSYSCNSFLQWAWNRAQVLKQNAFDLCSFLFDLTGMSLDSNACNTFSNCLKQLRLLRDLYDYVLKNWNDLPSLENLTKQLNNLQTTIAYLEIIKWSINVGLLPETPSICNSLHDGLKRQFVPYSVNGINIFFEKRRKLLKDESDSSCSNSLFIDNLINYGRDLTILKNKLKINGAIKYPLSCLRNVLEMYLEDSLSLLTKHQIFMYTLLDIAENLNDDSYKTAKEKLRTFSVVFKIPAAVTKVVEAFWQLDHGNYNDTIFQLLDPQIRLEDLEIWHHRILLNTLVMQDQYKLALLYLHIKKPPLLQVNDLLLIISLYIANNMLDEAYHFQKTKSIECGNSNLIQHFFKECINKNRINSLLGIPLTVNEENIFMNYLNDIQNPQLKFLKTYRLQKPECSQQITNSISHRMQETINTETSAKTCLPATVYPQIFDELYKSVIIPQQDQSLDVDTRQVNSLDTSKNAPCENTPPTILLEARNIYSNEARISNSFSSNPSTLLDAMVSSTLEKSSLNLEHFENNVLSTQINPEEKNIFTSGFEINENVSIVNRKEILRTRTNKESENDFSHSQSIVLNQIDKNSKHFEINPKNTVETIENYELEVHIINEKCKESSAILQKELRSSGLSFSKPINSKPDLNTYLECSSIKNIETNQTSCEQDRTIAAKFADNEKKLNTSLNYFTNKYQNIKLNSLWKTLSSDRNQKYTKTSRNNRNRKIVSLIRLNNILLKKDYDEDQKNKNVAVKDENLKTKNVTKSENEYLENYLKKNFDKTETEFKTNFSSFKENDMERLSTRLRLTPKKRKEKGKSSAVSLVRLRVTPIKQITENNIENTGLNKQSIISLPQLIKPDNEKLTATSCDENKTEVKIRPSNSLILDKLINRSTSMLMTEEGENKGTLEVFNGIKFTEEIGIEVTNDANLQNSEELQRNKKESIVQYPHKTEETYNHLLYVSTNKQDNSKYSNEFRKQSPRVSLNKEEESEKDITDEMKYLETAVFTDKDEINVSVSLKNLYSPNYNKIRISNTLNSQVNISKEISDAHLLIDVNSTIGKNIPGKCHKSTTFQNEFSAEVFLNYDQEHETIRERLSDFEKGNFQEGIPQVGLIDEVPLNSVSSELLNKAVIHGNLLSESDCHSSIVISVEKEFNSKMTDKEHDDSKISENDFNDAEQDSHILSPSFQYITTSDVIEKIEIRDSNGESDFLNNAFITDDTNFTEVDNMESRNENDCIKFVYAWVSEKGVNTSFPYESEESTDEEFNLNKSENRIEISEKSQGETTANVERYSQTVNSSRRKTSLLRKVIPDSEGIVNAKTPK